MTISNGQVADADEVLNVIKISQLYTSTAFDTTSGGTATASYEMTAIPSTDLTNANYVEVEILGTSSGGSGGGSQGGGSVTLLIEIKETGGEYGTLVTGSHISVSTGGASTVSGANCSIFKGVALLTAGMKANGFQIKLTSTSNIIAENGSSSFTNKQTTLKVMP